MGTENPTKGQEFPLESCQRCYPNQNKSQTAQCTAEIEDTVHALWSCPLLSLVWEQQREWEFRESKVFDTFKELVEFVV